MSMAFEGMNIDQKTLVAYQDCYYALTNLETKPTLAVLESITDGRWRGEFISRGDTHLVLAELNQVNAYLLQEKLPWLQPKLLGLNTSAGLGDRLGLATPGHVRAIRECQGKIAPIFPQQSMREMARTGRTPQEVMADAIWGVFRENWRGGFGADADHLKTKEDIAICFKAGFTFYTIDPGDMVDNRAENADLASLQTLSAQLPEHMQMGATGLLNQKLDIESLHIQFDDYTLLKAMVKYGKAIDHVHALFDYLKSLADETPFELEVSVDETEQPTSFAEHVYIASELKRLGVTWVSLAPRFVGRFEKGIDYIGDLNKLKTDLNGHAAIARHFGPYKLSLHSGSDKFSVYPLAMQSTQGLVHLKTAGTSYLEALHTIAMLDTHLMKEIYSFARTRFPEDQVSYHLTTNFEAAPLPDEVMDWPALLDQTDARQILHVTFGSVMMQKDQSGTYLFRPQITTILNTYSEEYAENLRVHILKHLSPFLVE